MSELPLHSGQSSPIMRRSYSISSDRPSLSGFGGLLSPPTSTSPDPAFIAASAASQIVTNDHDSQADAWLDQHGIEPSGETALVAAPALKLVNRFLDQLLFNFLSVSRSTSLAALRPAISEVLKPKLAKDAISGADQELHEYLGGGEDDEDLLALQNGQEASSDWDLELVWKRTRLRCMVYSSLGDMEEEDEDFYTEQDHLDDPRSVSSRLSNDLGVVSPAVAIFLTSVLEFMGEQVLIVAGQAAYHRLRTKHEKADQDETSLHADIAERVVVEEADMERVALDRTLGRLWRAWKKRIRSPTASVSIARSFSRESVRSSSQTRKADSIATDQIDDDDQMDLDKRRPSLAAILAEIVDPASVPLPMTKDDIREIEIPGLARNEDDVEKDILEEEDIRQAPRPKSWIAFPQSYDFAQEFHTTAEVSGNEPSHVVPRQRSNSEPRLMWTPFVWRPIIKPELSSTVADVSDETATHDKDAETSGSGPRAGPLPTEEAQLPDASSKVLSVSDGLSEETHTEPAKESAGHNGIVAGVIGGAAAIGPAAVAGIVAAAKGEAPETGLKTSHEPDTEEPASGSKTPTDSELEEEFKEVRIMNAHRVSVGSVGGRKTPDLAKRGSTRSSNRSPSVHSIRVVDVPSPRSPGSRHSSVGAADYAPFGRPLIMSHANGRHSPTLGDVSAPRVERPVSRGPTSSPATKSPSHGPRQKQNSFGKSISGVPEKEVNGSDGLETADPSSPLHPAAFAAALQGVDVPTFPSNDSAASKPVSVTSEPRAEVNTPRSNGDQPKSVTKVRILTGISTNGTTEPGPVTPTSPTTPSRDHQINGKHASPSSPARDTASRAQRSIHTSSSGSSSTSHRLKPVRTSEESPTNVEDKGQSFEQLIQSDQTIQYTLTPQSMRDIEAPEAVRKGSIVNSLPDARPVTSRSHSSSVTKLVGMKTTSSPESPKIAKPVKSFKPVPQPALNPKTRLRPNAPQPRDARVDRDSVGDFAEFIRSTGPTTAYEPNAPRSANGNSRIASGAGMQSGGSAPPKRAGSIARARLQARDAAVPRGDSISDLIDFVRSGPQLDKDDHRIPRNVAPFRSTMDSDEMSGAAGGRARDASLPEPRYSASVNGSITSSSPLINPSKNKPLLNPSKPDFDDEDRMPKRKTRRVRDPYAIDFSDEEEEYDAAGLSRPKVIEEESLADFLRNVSPPADPSPASLYPTGKTVKKKVSSSGLMSRLGRNPTNAQPAAQATSVPKTNKTSIAAPYSTVSAPTQQNRSGTYVSQVEGARKKVQQKSYQPREASYTSSSRTNDLAEFLKSEPPSSVMQTQPQTFVPNIQQKEEMSAFSRMFGRRKVH